MACASSSSVIAGNNSAVIAIPRRSWGGHMITVWVRILRTDVIRTTLISVLMGAKMQRLEVVRGRSEFLSDFSVSRANPTQPVTSEITDYRRLESGFAVR